MKNEEQEQIINEANHEEDIWKTIDLLYKGTRVNTTLIWFGVTMSIIAAINSLDGPAILFKALMFMLIGLGSIIFYKKFFKG